MNRPNQHYCFLADKHYDSNYKIIRAFSKELTKEIINNPDGVQMPKPFGYIHVCGVRNGFVRDHRSIQNHKIRGIKYQNYNTDGILFGVTCLFKKIFKGNVSTFKNSIYYKFRPYVVVKTAISNMVKSGKWKQYRLFDSFYDARQ